MTRRLRGESQREYVRRVLETDGHIATWDCLYEGRYEDGGRFSITRLAAVVWSLRHEDGLDISEADEPGRLAVYRLRRRPVPVARPVPPVPAWAQGWECIFCGSAPGSAPDEVLAGMARAWCGRCGTDTTFRRAA